MNWGQDMALSEICVLRRYRVVLSWVLDDSVAFVLYFVLLLFYLYYLYYEYSVYVICYLYIKK